MPTEKTPIRLRAWIARGVKDDLRTEGSELSDTPIQSGSTSPLAGRWQIPLLVVSLAALGLGIWRLRTPPEPPTFDELYAHATSLRDAGLYPEASQYIETLMADAGRSVPERRRLHRLMADVIHRYEKQNIVHGPNNSQRIVDHLHQSIGEGGTLDAVALEMKAQAFEWLRRPSEAIAAYLEAIAAIEGPHRWDLRKHVLELRRSQGSLRAGDLEAEWDAFIAATDADERLRYWALEHRVESLCDADQHPAADQLVQAQCGTLKEASFQKACDYLQALCWYHVGRVDDAERLLRGLRDTLVPGNMLYARAGWLLGRVIAAQDSPEMALAMYDDVIANTVPGPYRTAAYLGRAEVLSRLERFDESAAAYAETLRLVTDDPYESVVDLRAVRESTTMLYQGLLTQGRLHEAMAYLRVAAKLVPATDRAGETAYTERLADLALALGREETVQIKAGKGSVRQARSSFLEAGEQYRQLARLVALDDQAFARAVWNGADAFDLAGDRDQVRSVLQDFVRERPESTRTPDALLRLGQTCQADGDFKAAITWYQKNLTEYPRTPSAVASLVPLAQCFEHVGRTDLAETTLLRMVTRRVDDPMSLITPAAAEYRDALFALGALYDRTQQYEKSIARYAEALERYPDDPRSTEVTYLLADVCRHSAAQVWKEMTEGTALTLRSDPRVTYRSRLTQARDLYEQVIDRYKRKPVEQLGEIDRLRLQLSHLYRADALFDLARAGEPPDLKMLAEAVDLYERAAWAYQHEPAAMTAYVQMVDCQIRLGNVDKARMALQRARWTLRGIPEESFARQNPEEGRAYWEKYLTWLEKTPTLAGDTATAAATAPALAG